jgi:hypothetical protein
LPAGAKNCAVGEREEVAFAVGAGEGGVDVAGHPGEVELLRVDADRDHGRDGPAAGLIAVDAAHGPGGRLGFVRRGARPPAFTGSGRLPSGMKKTPALVLSGVLHVNVALWRRRFEIQIYAGTVCLARVTA